MGADDFIDILWEHQVTDLWSRIDEVDGLQSVCVPESDAPVSSTTTWGEQAILMRTPTDCFDCGCMVWKLD